MNFSLIGALQILFKILIFPGLLFVVVIGLFLAGIDRKLVARMQKRVGPPLRQPWFDFLKLLGKETIVPHAANKAVYLAAPVIGFTGLVVMALFIPVFGYSTFSGNGDLIVLLYLLTIPAVALIIGGSASGSPYAGIGISREMVTMMSYELPLIIILLSVARKVGGSALCFSLGQIVNWQASNGCLAFHPALIPAMLAMLLVIPAEVGTQPFDVAEAETEICEGPLIEYSGAPLAVFKLNTAMKMFIMTALFTNLFFGGVSTASLIGAGIPAIALDAVIMVLICIVVTFLSMSLIHAITARFKIEHLFKFYWTVVAGLAALSLVLVWFGL
jgi:NADH-quinone oxidoreductase subunit H